MHHQVVVDRRRVLVLDLGEFLEELEDVDRADDLEDLVGGFDVLVESAKDLTADRGLQLEVCFVDQEALGHGVHDQHPELQVGQRL